MTTATGALGGAKQRVGIFTPEGSIEGSTKPGPESFFGPLASWLGAVFGESSSVTATVQLA